MNSEFLRSSAETMARRLARETTAPLAAELAAVIGNVDLLRPAAAWSYGYGRYDAMSQRVSAFQPLANWTESRWQAGAELPDPQAGWVMLHASGGHPGNDEHHAAIRRWTAPRAGRLSISGQLSHSSPHGDGVRGRFVSSRSVLLLEVSAITIDVASSVD